VVRFYRGNSITAFERYLAHDLKSESAESIDIPKNKRKDQAHSEMIAQAEPKKSVKTIPILVTTTVETNAKLSFENGRINIINGVEKNTMNFDIVVNMISPEHHQLDMQDSLFDSVLKFVQKIQEMSLHKPEYHPKSQKENENDNEMLNSWFRLHMAVKNHIMEVQKLGGMVSYSRNLGSVMNFKSCLNSFGLTVDY
jgi:hypothetical protein